jgi:hypothetical protein
VARRCVWKRNLENEEAEARYWVVKIQPQCVVTPGKQTTNKHKWLLLVREVHKNVTIYPSNALWLLYLPHASTSRYLTFWPHNILMCFLRSSLQRTTMSLQNLHLPSRSPSSERYELNLSIKFTLIYFSMRHGNVASTGSRLRAGWLSICGRYPPGMKFLYYTQRPHQSQTHPGTVGLSRF